MDLTDYQELQDIGRNGKNRPWKEKKMANEMLAEAYAGINSHKAMRLRQCGSVLTYRVYQDGQHRLDGMTSCRVRLCPICTWRRSLKVYGQTREIVDKIAQDYGYRWILLTLTVRNCPGPELSGTIDTLLAGWRRLLAIKQVKGICKGWYRSMEVTHDTDPIITREMWDGDKARHIKPRKAYYQARGLAIGSDNPNYDTYHPHIHALIAVSPGYFAGHSYIKRADWAQLWQQACRLDYVPQVGVKSVKGATMDEIAGAVAEVAKYAAKDSEYIVPDDWDLTVDAVRTLDAALANRRLVAYGGVMRDVKRALGQDDVETGDLVHLDETDSLEGEFRRVWYFWVAGYNGYYTQRKYLEG